MSVAAAPHISFEVFPPKTSAQDVALSNAMLALANLHPDFVSVTCGAGGSTRVNTYATVRRVQERLAIPCAAHVTGQGHTKDTLAALGHDYRDAGIGHIVALRGDDPAAVSDPTHHALAATDVITVLRSVADFEISVAAYPETHPKAASPDADMDALKAKIDAGADRAITQFFFDAETFLRFRDRCARAGLTVPVVPGILPIHDFAAVSRMAKACGAAIPSRLRKRFARAGGIAAIEQQLGTDEAIDLCGRLDHEGVDAFHIYTLNRPDAAAAICRSLA